MSFPKISTFAERAAPLSAIHAKEAFGADFALEGSVRKAGDRTRVTAQLTDTSSGSQIWAERYDRDLEDVFALEDEIVGSILHALGAADGVIEETTRRRVWASGSLAWSAYDSYLRGRDRFYQHGDSGFREAEALFRQAIEQDEKFAPAYSALAWLYFVQFKLFRTHSFDEIRGKARELALQALRLDKTEFRAHWVLGGLFLHEGRRAQCLGEFEKAIAINPNDANLLAWSAEALVYCGEIDEALERCEAAIRLNPNCPDWYHWVMASALFHMGRYEDALAKLDRMSEPEHAGRLKAATYAHLGRNQEAQREAAKFMNLVPTFSISRWASTECYKDSCRVTAIRRRSAPGRTA